MRRLLLLTLILPVVGLVVLLPVIAHAEASWRSALAWSSASAKTECPGSLCADSDWHIGASTSATCASAGTCPSGAACTASAFALGRNNWTGTSRVSAAGCGSAGLAPLAITQDTLAVSLTRIDASTLRVTLTGIVGPGSGSGIAPVDTFRVVVWNFGTFSNPADTFDPIAPGSIMWNGSARLTDAGLVTGGALVAGDFTVVGDDYLISKSFDIAYSGSDNVIAVGTDVGHVAVSDVPTLSEWALLLLALLLIVSAALVYRRSALGRAA